MVDHHFDRIILNAQILGELYHVLTRKNNQSADYVEEIISEMLTFFPVKEIAIVNVLKAVEINKHYQYSYWDSLVIATSLLNGCRTLYSEDMQHHQLIEKELRIVNPFKEK